MARRISSVALDSLQTANYDQFSDSVEDSAAESGEAWSEQDDEDEEWSGIDTKARISNHGAKKSSLRPKHQKPKKQPRKQLATKFNECLEPDSENASDSASDEDEWSFNEGRKAKPTTASNKRKSRTREKSKKHKSNSKQPLTCEGMIKLYNSYDSDDNKNFKSKKQLVCELSDELSFSPQSSQDEAYSSSENEDETYGVVNRTTCPNSLMDDSF